MKNVRINLWSFTTVKLQAIRLCRIAALVAVIGFSMTACDNGSGTTGKTDPSVTWPTGLTATVGQTLSQVSLPGNAGTAGTFTWTNPTAPVGEAGQRTHNMTFTPSDTAAYNTVQNNVTITVTGGGTTNPDIGTGDQASRRYRMEMYNINSATETYLLNTYGGKNFQGVIRADVISRGHTAANTYTNQTFSGVTSIFSSSLAGTNADVTGGLNMLTEALQTNNRSGYCIWVGGSTNRFFYVNRTGTAPNYYTVEVYNINSATETYLSNTYGGKNFQGVIRADVISRGHTAANTYTNQTFSGVTSIFSSSLAGTNADVTGGLNMLTEALQTNNQSGYCIWVGGSANRFFYVTQE